MPGLMSATSCVPPGVPSELHSSVPCTDSVAAKNSVEPTVASCPGVLKAGIALTSARR